MALKFNKLHGRLQTILVDSKENLVATTEQQTAHKEIEKQKGIYMSGSDGA